MSNLDSILLNCEYFPSISWYRKFYTADAIEIEQYEFFKRASLHNRCYIAGPNGKMSLVVPLKGGRNQKTILKDVRISYDEDWRAVHWKSLCACYRRSPYFEFFEYSLEHLFKKKFEFLIDLNFETLTTINKLLSIQKKYTRSTSYQSIFEGQDMRWESLSNKGFEQEIRYIQPFEEKHGFVSDLSILDALFCNGKQTLDLLLMP